MNPRFGKTRHDSLAQSTRLVLCLLVLVFSFAAKLSWYQPKNVEMRGLTASKMWQQCELKAVAAIMAAPDDMGSSATHAAAWVSAVLLLFAVARWALNAAAVEWMSDREAAFSLRQTQFARVSQLRAPPVR